MRFGGGFERPQPLVQVLELAELSLQPAMQFRDIQLAEVQLAAQDAQLRLAPAEEGFEPVELIG